MITNLYSAFLSLLFLAMTSSVLGQELSLERVYVYGGPHVDDYAIFYRDGRFSLIRSEKLTYKEALATAEIVMEARYSNNTGNILFTVDNEFGASLIPVQGKVINNRCLTITFRNIAFPKPRELTRTYYLDSND